MKRFLVGLLLSLIFFVVGADVASSQSQYQFVLGFKTIASMIPDIVGEPLENEHHNPLNGDGLQATSKGLLVWRKADNWTAFTDGYRTWVNGPHGLQSRLNDQRFDWETAPKPAAPPATSSQPAAPIVNLSFSWVSGSWIGRGTVQNPGPGAIDVEMNVVGFVSQGGRPLMDAPTVMVDNLAAGSSRQLTVVVPTGTNVGNWQTFVSWRPATSAEVVSMDLGTTRPLSVDPSLVGTVDALRKLDTGDWLLRVAAESGVKVRLATVAAELLGEFNPTSNLVTLSSDLVGSSAWVRAAVLSHELQHAADKAAGIQATTEDQCYQMEDRAFQRQSEVWSRLWQQQLPPDVDRLHAELNSVARGVLNQPQFQAQLEQRYKAECSDVARLAGGTGQ